MLLVKAAVVKYEKVVKKMENNNNNSIEVINTLAIKIANLEVQNAVLIAELKQLKESEGNDATVQTASVND